MDVKVTNHNGFRARGRYAGIDYIFKAHQSLEIPEEAADHIFALKQDDKTGAMNRLGLLKLGTSYPEALKAFHKFTFTVGRVVFESPPETPPQPDEPKPEDEEDEDEDIGSASGVQPSAAPAQQRTLSPDGKTEAGDQSPSASASADLKCDKYGNTHIPNDQKSPDEIAAAMLRKAAGRRGG